MQIDTILASTVAADIEREPMTAEAELPGLPRLHLVRKRLCLVLFAFMLSWFASLFQDVSNYQTT